jgi:hypothetical protein
VQVPDCNMVHSMVGDTVGYHGCGMFCCHVGFSTLAAVRYVKRMTRQLPLLLNTFCPNFAKYRITYCMLQGLGDTSSTRAVLHHHHSAQPTVRHTTCDDQHCLQLALKTHPKDRQCSTIQHTHHLPMGTAPRPEPADPTATLSLILSHHKLLSSWAT